MTIYEQINKICDLLEELTVEVNRLRENIVSFSNSITDLQDRLENKPKFIDDLEV